MDKEFYIEQARLAFNANRYDEAYKSYQIFIEQCQPCILNVEQVTLFWNIILNQTIDREKSIFRLIQYHAGDSIETSEMLDHITMAYVNELELEQSEFCLKTVSLLDALIAHCSTYNDSIHYKRFQIDVYKFLSRVSRPLLQNYSLNECQRLQDEVVQAMKMNGDNDENKQEL
ncbi:unnamed protein product [Didymodactylos carnosus]|uniref:Uncharacterized protein n=1 Tax=Didymodactylos carnosus TaxID=1234261 RepID=A0A813WXG6_9BILA|nr:unnamed protein product [Didymodactylos carnosus]CAF3654893.1 unnamed protein product [Didymodactylos carnosus]